MNASRPTESLLAAPSVTGLEGPIEKALWLLGEGRLRGWERRKIDAVISDAVAAIEDVRMEAIASAVVAAFPDSDPDGYDADDLIKRNVEQVENLRGERDYLREALARATHLALGLLPMIDRETWRAQGGDDGQGHYEGDYHAEKIATELRELARLAPGTNGEAANV